MRTHCVHGHEYTRENTVYYGDGRRCKTCQRARQARRIQTYADKANWKHVACPECQEERLVTERTANRIKNGEFSGRCRECRHGWRKPPVQLRPVSELVQWWIDQDVSPREALFLWRCLSLSLPSTFEEKKAA